MPGPIVFISRSRIKPGAAQALDELFREAVPALERDKPGTIVFLAYTDEARTEVHIVHVFPDAEAMDRHLEGVDERAAKALELIETAGYEIFGAPSVRTLETMRGYAAELGVPLEIRPEHVGGYVRPGRG